MEILVDLKEKSYPIILQRGAVKECSQWIRTDRKVMILSDDGVPGELQQLVLAQFPKGILKVVKHGETSKSVACWEECQKELLRHQFSRKDCILALGGGVIGDLGGFVASTYMRGIDFINIPTTTLSQIDSSIGGKTAINVEGIKNCVGTFYQPKIVLIDPDVLKTLPHRHYINGLVEALKAGLIYDPSLFELFEKGEVEENIEMILHKALLVKKEVVEKDEKETGLRKILNFGHTIGHGIESYYHLHDLYHGEAVALGMIPFINNEELKRRVLEVYKKLNIRSEIDYDKEAVYQFICNDKKADSDQIVTIQIKELGKAEMIEMPLKDLRKVL